MIKKMIFLLLVVSFTSQSAALGPFAPENNKSFMSFNDAVKGDEVKVFLSNGDGVFTKDVAGPFTASKLIELYSSNELAANKKIKGKHIRITTVAAEIGENFAKEAYIRAEGKNQFESINLVVNGEDERILSMKTGDRVDMVCNQIRYVMHTPMLRDCTFSKDFAEEQFFPSDDIVDGSYEPKNKTQAILIFIYKSNESLFGKACAVSGKECIKAMGKVSNDFKIEPSFQKLIDENKPLAKELFAFTIKKEPAIK